MIALAAQMPVTLKRETEVVPMIALMAQLATKNGKQEELLQTLRSLAEEIKTQDGCQGCVVGLHGEATVLISIWEDQGSLELHLRSEQLGVILGASALLASPPSFRFSDADMPDPHEVIRKIRGESAAPSGGG